MPDSGMELDLTRLREPERMNPNRSLYEQGREDARTLILEALRAHGLHRWQPVSADGYWWSVDANGNGTFSYPNCGYGGNCALHEHQHLDWLFVLLEATL